jgi:hypothetical protein
MSYEGISVKDAIENINNQLRAGFFPQFRGRMFGEVVMKRNSTF